MEPLDRNQRNGEGLNLRDRIGMDPLSRNQGNGEGFNLNEEMGMEPLRRNQRNGEVLNLGEGIGMELRSRNQRNGEVLNLSQGIRMEPWSMNQRNGEGLNLSEGIGMDPWSRNLSDGTGMEPWSMNQINGEGLKLIEGIRMEPWNMNQRNGAGLNLSEGIGAEPWSRNQRNGEGLNLNERIEMEPWSMSQRNGEGLNLSNGIGMEPWSMNQGNGEGLNLSDGIGIEPWSMNQRNGAGLNLSEGIGMEPWCRNQRNGEGLNLNEWIGTEPWSMSQRNGEGLNLSEGIGMEPWSMNQRNGEGLNLSGGIGMESCSMNQRNGEDLNLSEGIGIESWSMNQRNGEGLNFSEGIGIEPWSMNQRNGEDLNLSEGIGMKRVSEGVEDDSVVKKVRFYDEIFGSHKYTDENVALEKVKDEHLKNKSQVMVFEKLDKSIGHVGKMDILKGGGIKNGAVGAGEFIVGCQEGGLLRVPEECHNAIQLSNWNLGNANGGSELGFDFNIPVLEAANGSTLVGVMKYTQRTVELNEIRSGVSDRWEERVSKGKMEQIEEIIPYVARNCNLELGVMNKDQDIGGSSPLGGEERYTREEKGKAKVDNSWLALTTLPMELDLQHSKQQHEAISTVPQLGSIQCIQSVDVLPIENVELRKNLNADHALRQKNALRERAIHFARYDAPREGSSSQETKLPTLETIKDLGNNPNLASTALKGIRERIPKRKDEKVVRWEASQHPENKEFSCVFPSLLDLSLKTLAENAEAIVSLKGIPDILRGRLTEILCNSRKMSAHMLDLLVQGSPTQIRIKDCSWLTEEQFCNSFRDFDRRNLMVLQLDLCGQPTLDHVLGTTIATASNSLPNLAILSLRGACRMSDRALEILVTSAPSLQSIDLSQCSLLTHASIGITANSLGSILKELCIDDCQSIDAIHILPSLEKMEHLELLSVAGIHSVCDQFVSELLTARGQNIKELDISRCPNLTDQSLKFIGDACANLHSLNISELNELTDVGLQFLANGCRSIRKLIFCRNNFSDEGIAAFLEASGACLEELSLNNCSKVSTSTALSLAKLSRKLLHLDLSWCRRISDNELGLIVDSCLSLKLLKLFGCSQITDVFKNGHSNTVVQIIGLGMTQIFDISRFDGVEALLKYSPVVMSSNS
ncbi:hypothetical protein MTR67_035556 [Solanum verrucosum]|uniref:F-box/LRR-repeat protein 15-like leucin rich repeat domain-containing protein n=1 Tax=Solanum verrucosum TaxID=315347 RepID=A0AAF0UAK1_SOLVR|nr:uncharacterized protein LOC125837664 [Solanum verrucosum]WMV42171.1 hypothetical protein MTR67_035556 [Solanum verrucosum]